MTGENIVSEAFSPESVFRALAENVPDIVFTCTVDGLVEYCSERWHRYTGQPTAQALGDGFTVHVHPDDLSGLLDKWAGLRLQGEEGAAEARFCGADGIYRWHRVKAAPYRTEDRIIRRWIGTLSDIHNERSAERSFRALAETVHTLVWAASPSGFVDYFNVRWQEQIADLDSLMGDGWSKIVHPDDLQHDQDAWRQSVATGEDYLIRLRLRMRTGEYRWYESSATAERDDAGRIIRWYGSSIDVHESMLLREELKDQDTVARLLQELARRTPSLLFSITPRGYIDFVNDRWSTIIGQGADSLRGFGWKSFVHSDDLTKLMREAKKHAVIGDPYKAEIRVKRFTDAYRWIEIRAEAYFDDSGRLVRWYGTGIDIDSQRRAIEALEMFAESSIYALTSDDVETMLMRIAEAALTGMTDTIHFDLMDSDRGYQRLVITSPDVPSQTRATIQQYSTDGIDPLHPIALAAKLRRGLLVPVVNEEYLTHNIFPEARREAWRVARIKSLAVAPMINDGKIFGTLTLLRTLTHMPFDQQDLRVVEEISQRAAAAMNTIRLRELAHIESLERDERFHRIADAIPQLMWVTDENGFVEWVNQRWFEYTGCNIDAVISSGWRTFIHPDDEAKAVAAWQLAAQQSTIYESEFRLRRKDGVYNWFLGRARQVETAAGKRWYGTNTNIDDARRASRTLNAFAQIGQALSESLDIQKTLHAVIEVIVPEFADWAHVALTDDNDAMYLAATHHHNETKAQTLEGLIGKPFLRVEDFARALSNAGSPELLIGYPTRTSEIERCITQDILRILRSTIGFSNALMVPLLLGTTVRGLLMFGLSESSRTFQSDDLPFFRELARRIAPAIVNAELYERERLVAQSFQKAALPTELPQITGFIFSALYEAGRSEALVGGDWYDAFKLLDGRIVISIGDVAGSGLRAAVTMSSIRQAIRGAAHVHADPELMLQAGDRALRSEQDNIFATAFVGVIDPIANTLTYKSAAHPPVLMRMPDGAVTELVYGGLPLGLREAEREASTVTSLVCGSTLFLYTDGLTESTHNFEEGERLLLQAIATISRENPHEQAAELARTILADGSRDDVAIMCIDIKTRDEVLHWTVDVSDEKTTKEAVRELIETLAKRHPIADLRATIELVLAELVGNLVRYAPAPAEFILEWDESHPIIHLRDNGPGFEFSPKLPHDIYSEAGRGLFLISALASEFNVTRRHEGGSHARVVFAV